MVDVLDASATLTADDDPSLTTGRNATRPAASLLRPGERLLCTPMTCRPRAKTQGRPRGSTRRPLTPRRKVRYQTRLEAFMYGKMSVGAGVIGTGAFLAAGMHAMTWLIAGGFAAVLGGLMLYRLATIKARR